MNLPAKDTLKKYARVAGTALVLGSLVFIGLKIWDSRAVLCRRAWGLPDVFVLAAASLAYGASCLFLATGWCALLAWTSQKPVAGPRCRRIYARTQIAKYAPGNVFHFVGRHALGTAEGWAQASMIKAASLEILFVIAASSAVAFVGMSLFGLRAGAVTATLCLAMSGLFLLAPFALHVLASRSKRLRGMIRPAAGWREIFRGLVPPYLCYVAHGLWAGAVLLGLCYGLAGVPDARAAGAVLTAFGLAWFAGFITPGAPAGLGVREMVIVAALSSILGHADSLVIALAFRLVTLAGDVLFFLWSYVPVRTKTA